MVLNYTEGVIKDDVYLKNALHKNQIRIIWIFLQTPSFLFSSQPPSLRPLSPTCRQLLPAVPNCCSPYSHPDPPPLPGESSTFLLPQGFSGTPLHPGWHMDIMCNIFVWCDVIYVWCDVIWLSPPWSREPPPTCREAASSSCCRSSRSLNKLNNQWSSQKKCSLTFKEAPSAKDD